MRDNKKVIMIIAAVGCIGIIIGFSLAGYVLIYKTMHHAQDKSKELKSVSEYAMDSSIAKDTTSNKKQIDNYADDYKPIEVKIHSYEINGQIISGILDVKNNTDYVITDIPAVLNYEYDLDGMHGGSNCRLTLFKGTIIKPNTSAGCYFQAVTHENVKNITLNEIWVEFFRAIVDGENKYFSIKSEVKKIEEMNTDDNQESGIDEKPTSNIKNNDYIVADSDKKKLEYADIRGFNIDDLALARNEIYARHGYTFSEAKYANYFNSKTWYKSLNRNDDIVLNEIELDNLTYLQKMEEILTLEQNGYY